MKDCNSQARAALRTYATLDYPPRYALMLTGAWGSGKSFMVDDLINSSTTFSIDRPDERGPVKISLYGASSPNEISDRLFAALHPILSSKAMRIGGALLRGALRTTVKIDLSKELAGSSANLSLPDFDIPDFLKNVANRLLIFDDFERCRMVAADVLAYLNQLVEGDECKVIIIANEDKIRNEADSLPFSEIKEKTIGLTIRVAADPEEAFVSFLNLIGDDDLREFYRANQPLIINIFDKSGYENLRLLRMFILDFGRIYSTLTPLQKDLTLSQAAPELLSTVMAVFLAVRSGELEGADIKRLDSVRLIDAAGRPNSDPQVVRAAAFLERFRSEFLDNGLISYEDIAAFVTTGYVNAVGIQQTLLEHPYFKKAETLPSWRAMWFSHQAPESEALASLRRFNDDFQKRLADHFGEVLHIAALVVWLSDLDAEGWEDVDPVKAMKAYIDDLLGKRAPKESELVRELDILNVSDGWDGLGYRETRDHARFHEIRQYLIETWNRWRMDSLPSRSAHVLSLLKKDPSLFLKEVCRTPGGNPTYANLPVLRTITPEAFSDTFLTLDFAGRKEVLLALRIRYEHWNIHPNHELSGERWWVQAVYKCLCERITSLSPIVRDGLRMFVDATFKEIVPELA